MPDERSEERRSARRAPIAGVRVTYEDENGQTVGADVLDMASGGLFIRTQAPLPVGRRIAVDLTVVGEPGPWAAIGRVVWVREADEDGRPPGMGVKLIDVDDATTAALERLLDTREPTAPGVGGSVPPVAPNVTPAPAGALAPPPAQREPTLVGVGEAPDSAHVKTAPVAHLAGETSHEAKVVIAEDPGDEPAPAEPKAEAVAAEATSDGAAPEPPATEEEEEEEVDDAEVLPQEPDAETLPLPPKPPREATVAMHVGSPPPRPARRAPPPPPAEPEDDRAGRWVVALLLLVVAGVAAYVLFDGFLRPLGH